MDKKIYLAHGLMDSEGIEIIDGNAIMRNHPAQVKKCDTLIFKLNKGVISKGILNEINAAQEVKIPVYLWKDGRLTDDPTVLSELKLRKWKRKFKDVEHPFRRRK